MCELEVCTNRTWVVDEVLASISREKWVWRLQREIKELESARNIGTDNPEKVAAPSPECDLLKFLGELRTSKEFLARCGIDCGRCC
jgi:hypothetical protein